MFVDRSTDTITLQPMPGEIWAVDRDAHFDTSSTIRYLAIIREPQAFAPELVSVMVLSEDIRYLSDLNILIPPAISGLKANILAQTGNVGEMAIEYLKCRVGKRLSRQIYDLLLSIGDVDRGLVATLPSPQSIQSLGLQIAPDIDRLDRTAIAKFDRDERVWLLGFQPAKLDRITKLVATAIEIEREFIDLAQRIDLSQWLQNIFPPQWQKLSTFHPYRQVFARSSIDLGNISAHISDLLFKLRSSDDVLVLRESIAKLSVLIQRLDPSTTVLRSEIIQTTIEILNLTQDREIFWNAIACLRQLNPTHPRAGISGGKSIDLGEIVNLVITIVSKQDNEIGIWLQIHPNSGAGYLPIGLKLVLWDRTDRVLREIVARSHDYCLQLKFSGEVGEAFNLGLELDGVSSIDRFVI